MNTVTIWKYILHPTDEQVISMPAGAKILCVQVQRGEICLWAVVKPGGLLHARKFLVKGTGNPFEEYCALTLYIGTVQLDEYGLVFHVFEDLR